MTAATGDSPVRRLRVPTVESLVVGALVLFGYRAGLKGISDNSAYVHIRTGIEMARHGWHVAHADPYSFTAHGHAWVVQSWLASAVYGAAYQWVGAHFLVFVNGVLAALLAWVIATLARTGNAVRTMASATIAVLASAVYWAQRPLMFGLLALGALILVVNRRANPWWIMAIGWVWVNTHGSFPLGAAWLAALVVGEAIDSKRWPSWLNRYLVAFIGSMALGAVSPIGPKLLAFPFAVESKRSVFKNVVEWRSPDFQSAQGLATLGLFALALLILFRTRMPWRDVLPVTGFLALALLSVRNVSPAAIVLAPALGRALRTRPPEAVVAPGEPSEERGPPPARRGPPAGRLNASIAGVLVFAALLFTVGERGAAAFDFRTYPTAAEQYMADHGLLDPTAHRVAAQDIVGCYLILLRGTKGRVFIDDRVDMYPIAVSNDYDNLLHGVPDSEAILDRYRIDTVLWDRRLPLVQLLENGSGWRQAYPALDGSSPDHRWVVLVRVGAIAS